MFALGFTKISKEILKGGKGDNKPDSDFDKKSLKDGMKVESEHTKNKKVEKEIAKDHLSEDKKYYKKLHKMEKKASLKDKAQSLGKFLHTYRRDLITGTAAAAAVSSAISNKKMGDKK